MDWTFEEQFNS